MSGFWRGFGYAWRGVVVGSRGRNFRVMLVCTVVVTALGWWLAVPPGQAALLALSMGLVLSLELLNTAGEMLVDILCPGRDERYGRVKDVLAGAVLVAAAATVMVGVLVLGRPLCAWWCRG